MQSDYEEYLNQELELRIKKMEEPEYQFAKRLSRKDYIMIGIVVVFCLVALLIGCYI